MVSKFTFLDDSSRISKCIIKNRKSYPNVLCRLKNYFDISQNSALYKVFDSFSFFLTNENLDSKMSPARRLDDLAFQHNFKNDRNINSFNLL